MGFEQYFRLEGQPADEQALRFLVGVSAQAVELLLGRGPIAAAPGGMHFDAFRYRLARNWRPRGNHHPIHRRLLRLVSRRLQAR